MLIDIPPQNLPEYIRWYHHIVEEGSADRYLRGGKTVLIFPNSYDVRLFPALEEVEKIYITYRGVAHGL